MTKKEPRKGDTYFIKIDKCIPNDWNPNEMNDDEFNRLVREIDESGNLNPILLFPLDDGNYLIISGEKRWLACKLLGHDEIESKLLTKEKFRSKDLQRFVTMRQQVIQGKINPRKFLKLYEKLVKRYSDEALQELMAFTDSDKWLELTKGVEKALSATGLPDGFMDEFNQKSKQVKDVDDLGLILDSLFEKHGHDLKYHFLVFTFAGKDHYYIQMDDSTFRKMNGMISYCRDNMLDINLVFRRLIEIFHDRSRYGVFLDQCKILEDRDEVKN